MFARSFNIIFSFYLSSLAAAQTIQFDGRVPENTELTEFDSANDLFGSDSVLGEGLKFSDLLLLPGVDPSLFDDNTVPIEVTIRYVNQYMTLGAFTRLKILRS